MASIIDLTTLDDTDSESDEALSIIVFNPELSLEAHIPPHSRSNFNVTEDHPVYHLPPLTPSRSRGVDVQHVHQLDDRLAPHPPPPHQEQVVQVHAALTPRTPREHVTASPDQTPTKAFPCSTESRKHFNGRHPSFGRVAELRSQDMRSHTPSGDPPGRRSISGGRFRASSSSMPRPHTSLRESRVSHLSAFIHKQTRRSIRL